LNLEPNLAKLSLVQNEKFNNKDYSAPLIRDLNELEQKPSASAGYPTPDNPPWNSLAAFGVWLASFLFIAVIPLFLVIPYANIREANLIDGMELGNFLQTDSNAILLGIIGVFPAHLLTLLLAWIIVTRFKKYSFRQTLGWERGGFSWWYYPLILIGIFVVSAAALYLVPEQDNDLQRILRSSPAAVYTVAILATFTAPLVEEVIYRGILYSAFQRTFGVTLAVVFVTVVFAAVHFVQYWGSPSTIFLICFLSLILTLVRVHSKNLLPCIILHTLINGIQSIFLVLQTLLPDLNTAQNQTGVIIQ
jgi:uncharacterized protein